MSTAVQAVLFDYDALDPFVSARARQNAHDIKLLTKRVAHDTVAIGEKLTETKADLGYGHFGAWLEAEFDWSYETANNLIRVADAFKSVNFTELHIAPSALYTLAAPSTPESARVDAVERAQAGEKITYSTARAIVDEHRAAEKMARNAARARRDDALDARPVTSAVGPFDVLYVDPPWQYEHVETENRAIENHYPTMELTEICSLAIPSITAPDCVLFLWATSPKLWEAMRVLDAWGFNYRTCAVWIKDKIGMGYYFRQRHELLLVATIGKPGAPDASNRPDSVISAPRQEHSAKPEQVYGLIEAMYPRARKAELFARSQREGWIAWGNQA